MVVAGWKPSTQFPAPSQESVPSQTPPFDVPVQVVVLGALSSAGQAPDVPVQLSGRSQGFPFVPRQMVVDGWKPSTQFPAPSQESVPSQTPPFDVPVQVVVLGALSSAGQAPDVPVQLSSRSQGFPFVPRQMVVDGWKPSTQFPAPSQESVPSQAPPFDVPVQVVVLGALSSAGQAPDVPVQLSARSQGFPFVPRQMVVDGWKPSTQFPAPSQESVPSQTPPFDVPVQVVVLGALSSAGQAPDVPVQLSSRSQGFPFVPRQMVVDGWKPSTQFPAPSQESVPSQAPPFDVPVQVVVLGALSSAGQAPDVPVQLSSRSQGFPFVPRQMVVDGWKPSTQFPAPSQESAPPPSPPFDVPVQVVVLGALSSAGQAPDVPVQLSSRSQGFPFVPRQMVVDDLKPSTHFPAPSQESVPSQAPPFDVPVQVVVSGLKPSAGQSADVPVQLSATSH